MKISNEVANAIRKSLAEEPPREAHRSRAALIRDLAPELIKARKDKNLSLDDLRAILQKSGLQISVGTLKNYLSQSRRPAREMRLAAAAARPKAKPEDGSMSQMKTRADKAHRRAIRRKEFFVAGAEAGGRSRRRARCGEAGGSPNAKAAEANRPGESWGSSGIGASRNPADAEAPETWRGSSGEIWSRGRGSGAGVVVSAPARSKHNLGDHSMNKPIYVVGGSKGGVGKSLVTMALVHYLKENDEEVFLIDADTSNPDVLKSYEEDVTCKLVNLDDADGWIQFVNICDENRDCVVVVNTAARNNVGVAQYGGTLSKSLDELQRNLVTLWVINRQRDSLELMQDYAEAIGNSALHVVKNGYFGADAKFELYNGSDVRKAVERKGGRSVLFPDMADRVSDALYSDRLSIAKAWRTMPIGNRAELRRWLEEVNKIFPGLVDA